MEKARSVLRDSDISKRYCSEAVSTSLCLKNVCPTVGATPEEVWTGSKVDLSHLRVFGCKTYALTPENKCKKIDAKSNHTSW
jgi:hypothetical protein